MCEKVTGCNVFNRSQRYDAKNRCQALASTWRVWRLRPQLFTVHTVCLFHQFHFLCIRVLYSILFMCNKKYFLPLATLAIPFTTKLTKNAAKQGVEAIVGLPATSMRVWETPKCCSKPLPDHKVLAFHLYLLSQHANKIFKCIFFFLAKSLFC